MPALLSSLNKVLRRKTERKFLPADWRRRLQLIQQKVTAAAQRAPIDAGLELGQACDYWLVAQIRDNLAATATKTLLGGLTGPAGDWDKLVRAYETKSKSLTSANQRTACLASAPTAKSYTDAIFWQGVDELPCRCVPGRGSSRPGPQRGL